ncbi:Rieske domain-containing protein-like [Ostrea edulis]|uniref:Rieske domain-containing protein-like n=1 Tax=Ostrea edulis TaxID=37623 RepID=UPI0024AEB6F8|nr:Rieske domain-containing protein-like [Ostrea edulis]
MEGTGDWRCIGKVNELSKKKCQRLYSAGGKMSDLALFFHEGKFYAMEAWCSHLGGPLFSGEIEDYKGRCHVMCPWHGYMFDLQDGKNEIGLQQEVHEVKIEGEDVFIFYKTALSTSPSSE